MKRNVEGFIEEGKTLMRKCQGWKDIRPYELAQIIETGKKDDGSTDVTEIALSAFNFGVAVAKRTVERDSSVAAAVARAPRKKDPELSVRHKDRTKITLKAARIASGLTQRELADRIGVSTRTVTACENGERQASAKYLYQFSVATGFSVDDLE